MRAIEWSVDYYQSFEKLKTTVTLALVMRLYDFERPSKMHIDVLIRAIGVVQKGYLIAFESQTLTDVEQKYSIHKKEMTTTIHCLGVWRVYLSGSRFIIKIDNIVNTSFKI